jgi:hypothetical protein
MAYRADQRADGRRLVAGRLLPALSTVALCALALIGFPPQARAATMSTVTWSVSKSVVSNAGVTYAYQFTIATASAVSSFTMTVPGGTAGTPSVTSVSPSSVSGGTVSLTGTTLTYSFSSASLAVGTAVSVQIGGMTNTATAGSSTSTVTTLNGASSVDTGTSNSVTISANALTAPVTWSVSSAATGAASVSYTYAFTLPAGLATTVIDQITFSVPPGTGGTPALGTVSPATITGSVAFSGTTLTFTGVVLALDPLAPTNVSIQITGLTNTVTAGNYTAEIVASNLTTSYSGVTGAVSLTGILALTSPSLLGWSATMTGSTQNVTDTAAAHQQLSVDDESNTGAGWHVTVAATTLTAGAHSLANSGTLVVTGSTSSASATTAPSDACNTSCRPPVSSASYPVAVTTAGSSPTPVTVYDVAAGSGIGPVILGGSTAANPVGWWIAVPPTTYAGTYTSTFTITIVSGP